jgi:hypothetical protein
MDITAADNALEFDAITADGDYVTANANQNSDLFWALKGGGPSTYAVILSVTFKTFVEQISAGAVLNLNFTMTTNETLFWEGVRIFHKYSNSFVDAGLYVYFEVGPLILHVRPWVAIGKTAAQLNALLAPMKAEMTANGVPFDSFTKDYPTFFQLYIDLFEDEAAGAFSLTGGWAFTQRDVAENNDGIVKAFQTVISPRADLQNQGYIVAHLWNPGYAMPVPNSATNPIFRNTSDFAIFILPVPINATLAQKADLQNVLTNVQGKAMMDAGKYGCTYVNEVSLCRNVIHSEGC